MEMPLKKFVLLLDYLYDWYHLQERESLAELSRFLNYNSNNQRPLVRVFFSITTINTSEVGYKRNTSLVG